MGQRVWLWNTRTAKPIHLAIDYNVTLNHAAFSPDGRRVLAVMADGTAHVWDVGTGSPVTALLPQNGVARATFSPDGSLAATASLDGTARVWDSATGEALTPPLPMPSPTREYGRFSFTPTGRLLVKSNQGFRVWHVPTTTEDLKRLQARARLLSGSRIDPDPDIGSVPVTMMALRAAWTLVGGPSPRPPANAVPSSRRVGR